MTDKSTELQKISLSEGIKYDYFIVGISAATFAYFAKDFAPEAFGLNEKTFILLALVFLVISIISGLKTIEKNKIFLRENGKHLELHSHKAAYVKNINLGTKEINMENGDILDPETSVLKLEVINKLLPESKKGLDKMLSFMHIGGYLRDYGFFMGLFFLSCGKLYPAFWS